ncbi:uncharacterized protein LOC130970112 [Arachis stenosperma]|uniref:uncharacterized protein LOC130970112 n=1 Tax=Arachis stenosperma TaxID=217475 RepID=UPI0025AD3566|nr:uncharacterized protein LOC130970112 [Arachis stenosperma]
MSRQVIVVSNPPSRRRRACEVAGGSAAECAAVVCCCPCAVINLAVLAIYRVPAGLVRKALHKKKRHRMLRDSKNDVVLLRHQRSSGLAPSFDSLPVSVEPRPVEEKEVWPMEKEMWARFAETGFWRSESQRQP